MFFPVLKSLIVALLLAACVLGACGRIERPGENINGDFSAQFPAPTTRGAHGGNDL